VTRAAVVALAAGLALSAPAAHAQDPSAAAAGVRPLDARDLDSLPLDADGRTRIAQALAGGAYDEAQGLLLVAYARNPQSPELLRLLGGVLFVTGEYLNSAIALKKAEALAPLDARSRFTLAMAYVVLRRRPWARPELEALAAADAGNPLYPYWLARLEYDEEHYAAAVDGFRRALALDPEYLKAHDNMGLALDALGRYDEAIKSYEEALRLNRARGAHSPEAGDLRRLRRGEHVFQRLALEAGQVRLEGAAEEAAARRAREPRALEPAPRSLRGPGSLADGLTGVVQHRPRALHLVAPAGERLRRPSAVKHPRPGGGDPGALEHRRRRRCRVARARVGAAQQHKHRERDGAAASSIHHPCINRWRSTQKMQSSAINESPRMTIVRRTRRRSTS